MKNFIEMKKAALRQSVVICGESEENLNGVSAGGGVAKAVKMKARRRRQTAK